MNISEIKIKNFKGFKELSFKTNPEFNVIIGENNIGKSTIFEGLLLWESCFKKTINAKRNGFYKADGKNSYIPFKDLSFLRLINDTDLFFERPNSCRITVKIQAGNDQFTLTFEIDKPKSISNSYLRYKTINQREFENFANYMRGQRISLDRTIFIYQTKPVSNILSQEPFMNKAQILRKISEGKSGEVLRNKIINKKGQKRESIQQQISNVLGSNVVFQCVNENKLDLEEFIILKINGLDIHLQGSGLLQVTEIFSTIDYLENSINVLLIDEPDSHIHSKLQKKLLQELRRIQNTQTFIISHNDNFVNELNPSELFYLNQEAKTRGEITRLVIANFDKIKKDLGGVIMALDKLNYCDKVCFVEGDDDINYIDLIKEKIIAIDTAFTISNNVSFYFLRGKDNLLQKLEYHKRFMSQLFRDKAFFVIYDKDFSPELNSANLNAGIIAKLGRNSNSRYHNGYCFESILFSDTTILINFLSDHFGINNLRTHYFVMEYIEILRQDFLNVNSILYQNFEQKFNGQQNGSRPDLIGVRFSDFVRDCYTPDFKPQFFFNKYLIKDFLEKFVTHFGIDYTLSDRTDEFYSSSLFKNYISWLSDTSQIFPGLRTLIGLIYT